MDRQDYCCCMKLIIEENNGSAFKTKKAKTAKGTLGLAS